MLLKHALRLDLSPGPVRLAFSGAGGKTSAMFCLARELDGPVLLTATTHLALEQLSWADQHQFETDFIPDLNTWHRHTGRRLLVVTGPVQADQRTAGLRPENLERWRELADQAGWPLLIEADGARRLPLKAPAFHEPQVPDFVDLTVVVAGLSGLGQPLDEQHVHRPELFAALAGIPLGAVVTAEALIRVLADPQGGLRGLPATARRVALLNQADGPALQAAAQRIAGELLPAYQAVISACLQSEDPSGPALALYEPVGAVILAAGAAQRFGQPKQLLDWQGKPLVWHVARTACQAGLAPVVVVAGEQVAAIRRALVDLPVEVSANPDWQAGQSSSINAGLRALPADSGAAVFLLADQPQIPATLVRQLVAEHRRSRAALVAPVVDGRRGNPVLFDRATFPDLLQLRGDQGGRQLFSKYRVTWLPWHDQTPLLDIDTPADYRRLLESEAPR